MSENIPKSSIASVGSYMLSLKLSDRAEKGILVRVGTLIDGIINAQRGHSNSGAKLDPRKVGGALKKPPKLVGSSENIFNGAAITIDPIRTSTNLSSYEVQIDDQVGFPSPSTKITFNKSMIFKGLAAGTTYYIRARGLTKTGEAGDWVRFANVVTTPSTELISSDIVGALAADATQAQSRAVITNFSTEDFFGAASWGMIDIQTGGGSGGEGGEQIASQWQNWVRWKGGHDIGFFVVGTEANRTLDVRYYEAAIHTEETLNISAAGYYDADGNYVRAVSNEVQVAMRTQRMPHICFYDLFNPATGTSYIYGASYDTAAALGYIGPPDSLAADYPVTVYFNINIDNTFDIAPDVEPWFTVLF